jgi:hypothetical protein
MSLSFLPRLVCALAAPFTTGHYAIAPRNILPSDSTDSAVVAMISEELRAYYRDLHDRNWTQMITHFYPAKVTARFAVPDTDPAWAALAPPRTEPHDEADAHGYCSPRASIAIVGSWARVLARRCTGELDESWFYSMSGRWKMIHLVSAAALTTATSGTAPGQPSAAR